MMRLDAYLKRSRLIKRRPLAKQYCDRGVVKVNGTVAKAARVVRENDELELDLPNLVLRVRVLRVPEERQPRGPEEPLYSLLSRETKNPFA